MWFASNLVWFVNFNGCSQCLKELPTTDFGKKPNCGGFDFENWMSCDSDIQRRIGDAYQMASTAAAHNDIKRIYGIK